MRRIFSAVALFLGLMGSFLSMLAWGVSDFTPLFSAGLRLSGIGDGFLLVFNRLFEMSEQQQLFRYVMFTVSLPEGAWAAFIALALVLFALLFIGLCAALVLTRRKIWVIIFMVVIVGVQVYFGVFPSAGWNVLLFGSLAWLLTDGGKAQPGISLHNGVALLVMLVVIATAFWVFYPGQNAALHAFSESIRDRFDNQINPFAVEPFDRPGAEIQTRPEDRHLALLPVQDENLNESHAEAYAIQHEAAAQGAEVGFMVPLPSLLPAVLFVFTVLLIAAGVHFIPPLWRTVRRRRRFDTDASGPAIHAMFRYQLEWLEIMGLKRENQVFSAYAPRLATLISPAFASEYEKITTLWQKTLYSDFTSGEAERKTMRAFLNKTMDIVWKNAGIFTKLKIKFHYFL